MKKKPINTEKELKTFLKEFRISRLRKKLSISEVFRYAGMSLRTWYCWRKKLKKGEERDFPNPSQVKRIKEAVRELPARKRLILGRPGKADRA